jgi:hypothetical protein
MLLLLLLVPADETVYDSVLLLDRVMSIPLKVAEGLLGVTMAACLMAATAQSGLPEAHLPALVSIAPPRHSTHSIAMLRCACCDCLRCSCLGRVQVLSLQHKHVRSPFPR